MAMLSVLAVSAPDATAMEPVEDAHFDILAYQVVGNTQLQNVQVERAVYPFLGPQRTAADVEQARAALQGVYEAAGLATVAVSVPEQDAASGLVTLQVTEQRVGRVRVVGADYYSPDDVIRGAPSLAEGSVPNFKDVQRDIVALNQLPDRRVTPQVQAGAQPNTVDVDLAVDDALPLHGSLELNNRKSANTSELRLSAAVHYDNLWQRGHSLNFSAQTAPQNPDDARVYSASYLARFSDSPFSLLGYSVRSDSEVAAINSYNVIGNGSLSGLRLIRALPNGTGFFHSLSLGVDYKDFKEDTVFGSDRSSAPIRYAPLSAAYNASWVTARSTSALTFTATANLRGVGDDARQFDAKRYRARPNFMHLRADGSQTRTLGEDIQLYAHVQTQLAAEPLISNEQFSLGGLDSVRGYDESQALGDFGAIGQLELRSPSFGSAAAKLVQEARVYAFVDGGYARIRDPLPEQRVSETLISTGLGFTFKAVSHLNGAVDLAAPLSRPDGRKPDELNVLFRLWGEF
ncbi:MULTISPECIES: ShlB/FhaC/HecB family hemolysin secretion/activation protein [Xanthomonas]|uniref:ShlB/FhaC/HecB family hemolysin secretion/activation protein n=1 Tax=Xanthomonas TaxID=338 RepID=UPI001EDCBD04|nr:MULTISPECIES: ShlB/FhaC/HecB family hemolysin secretion/activation protein [Xanthomonas]